jgi:transposase-like protein
METEPTQPTKRVMRRYSREAREQFIEAWKDSGQTRQVFCDEHNIHPTTFSGWLKRAKAQPPKGFAEVELPQASAVPIEVHLPNGMRIDVRTTGDLSRTAELIRRVTGAQPC